MANRILKIVGVALILVVDSVCDRAWAMPDREQSKAAVQAHLAPIQGAERGQLLDVQSEVLTKTFPRCQFFTLRFRVYPIAVEPQPPLKTNNLFAVCDGKVTPISDQQQLEDFFTKHLPAGADHSSLRSEIAESWLYLFEELNQDGFFEFERPVVHSSGMVVDATADVVAQRGDKGKLTVQMEFEGPKLTRVSSQTQLLPGVRPRCQATRLLDEDFTVRAIMRQDILVMGHACKPYLDEVRASASAELRQAIDDVWNQIVNENR